MRRAVMRGGRALPHWVGDSRTSQAGKVSQNQLQPIAVCTDGVMLLPQQPHRHPRPLFSGCRPVRGMSGFRLVTAEALPAARFRTFQAHDTRKMGSDIGTKQKACSDGGANKAAAATSAQMDP